MPPELRLLLITLAQLVGSILILLVILTVVSNLIFGGAYDRLAKPDRKDSTDSPSSHNPTPKD